MLLIHFRLRSRAPSRLPTIQLRRSSSIDFVKLRSELKSRRLPILVDYLTPQPSRLLQQTLKDFLPSYSYNNFFLSPGHHLVYFANPVSASHLLPDGTDTAHSPGPPFTRRLWAGGRIDFENPKDLPTDGRKVGLVERISDVSVRGKPGSEKVFVQIERHIVNISDYEEEAGGGLGHAANGLIKNESSKTLLLESRELCFLGDDSPPLVSLLTNPKTIPPPPEALFKCSITPTPSLLFRYSALTFNAHAIHIDPEYTRQVYGLPKLLVHGPLCVTLMLECLGRELQRRDRQTRQGDSSIASIHYRNLGPLFLGEEMRVCGRMASQTSTVDNRVTAEEWEVWIEKRHGDLQSLAVRGTIRVNILDSRMTQPPGEGPSTDDAG